MRRYFKHLKISGGGGSGTPTPPAVQAAAAVAATASQPVTDISAYPVLTEEVGYPPSPLARPAGAPYGVALPAGAPLGQVVAKAVSDVLGWKIKPGDTKGFVGALNQAFTLTEVEGHIESKWRPQSYPVQSEIAAGITGAQASVYARGKEALDQCLPLIDGLYALNPEAIAEDVAALKAVAKSQLSELINELGFPGAPRVTRINTYFNLLLGGVGFPLPPPANNQLTVTDPDQISGTLGNLRDDLGLSFTKQDFVNSLEDETNLSNFRIISDYVTSLAQSWLNNVSFVVLGTTTPFFGTQLILMSRQLSVVAESVDEVRFTLDSVFVGPAERQTTQLNFPSGAPPMFLEDLLSWIHDFATEEGPRLIQDGGKFGVQDTFVPVSEQLLSLVTQMLDPSFAPLNTLLPPGFYTQRVQLSLQDLRTEVNDLADLAKPLVHQITPEPAFGLAFEVAGLSPNSVVLAGLTPAQKSSFQIQVRGSGFQATPLGLTFGLAFNAAGTPTRGTANISSTVYFRSDAFLIANLNLMGATPGTWDIQVQNADGTFAVLQGAFTVS
jgi:hypothetical protein